MRQKAQNYAPFLLYRVIITQHFVNCKRFLKYFVKNLKKFGRAQNTYGRKKYFLFFWLLKKVFADCLYGSVGDKAGAAVRGVDTVQRKLRIGDTFGNAVEHLVIGDELVRKA